MYNYPVYNSDQIPGGALYPRELYMSLQFVYMYDAEYRRGGT